MCGLIDDTNSRVFPQGTALKMLEPCAGKLARTVLRGLGDSNVPSATRPDPKTLVSFGEGSAVGTTGKQRPFGAANFGALGRSSKIYICPV